MRSPLVSRLEAVGLVGALSALGCFLVRYRVLHPESDPMRWFAFARDFTDRFAQVKLAYGFPLVASFAVEAFGPVAAFSINIPLLLVLTATLYVYARWHVARAWLDVPGVAAVAGGVTLLCFAAWNTGDSSMLLRLSNPYRDPLSYVLLLGATLALMRTVRGGGAMLPAAVGGALFAFACSTRETSILMAAPLVLFALFAREGAGGGRRGGMLRWRAGVTFCVVFAVALLPLLLQNWMHSGSAVVPAQASGTVGVTRTYFSGLGLVYLPRTFPSVVSEWSDHVGAWGLVLVATGLGVGVWARLSAALLLSLPALLIYGGFYSAYYAVVPRYLFVLDLFAAPLAGAGAAGLWVMVWRRAGAGGARRWVSALAGLLLLTATAVVAVRAPGSEWLRVDLEGPRSQRLRVGDVRGIGAWLAKQAPPPALMVSENPLSSLLRTFFDYDVVGLMFDTGNRNLKKRAASERLIRRIRERDGSSYYLRGARGAPAGTYLLESEFDLVPVGELEGAAYHLPALYPGVEALSLERIVPWARLDSAATVVVPEAGHYWLTVDVGRLSRWERGFARVSFGGRVLDEQPRDQRNHYLVEAERAGEVVVELVSDAPVPQALWAVLEPASSPIIYDLRDERRLRHATRLSDEFFRDVIPVAPVADGGAGSIDLSFPEPRGAVFQVLLIVSLMGDEAELRTHHLSLDLDEVPVYRAPVGQPKAFHGGWGSYEFAFAVDGRRLTGSEGRLRIAFAAAGDLGRPPRPVLLAVEVYRHDREGGFDLQLGTPGDDPFVVEGFPVRDESAIEAGWPARFTGARARIPVFGAGPGQGGRLRVEYLVGLEAAGVDPPRPQWFFNGHPLQQGMARRSPVILEIPGEEGGASPAAAETGRRLDLVAEIYDVPPEWSRGSVNELGIVTSTWSETSSEGGQELGILLHRIRFGPRSEAPRRR